MNILVTGTTGYIGSQLANYLSQKYKIFALVRDINKAVKVLSENINIIIYKDINYFIRKTSSIRFDGIIHLASNVKVVHKIDDINNLINSNITFGTELLEFVKCRNVKWFINTGTFWQHYNNENYNPVNLYAATKEAFEIIAKYYVETSDLVFTTIKLNDTFGHNDTRKKIFNLWIDSIKNNTTLDMSKGEQIIDISYIEDIISAYDIMIENLSKSDYKKYNLKSYVVSNNQRLTLKELAKLFEKVAGKKLKINWGARNYKEREIMIPYNKDELVPNWKQKYSLEEAIRKTIKEIM